MPPEDPDEYDVFAAGGIILRWAGEATEVLLVHRPRYDDWTLPKGKADPGETPIDTALREVREETALACVIVGDGGTAWYGVSAGRKRVDYFTMRAMRDLGFAPNDEVDDIAWMSLGAAHEAATYSFDQELLAGLDLAAATTPTVSHLVRHGAAGDRSKWPEPDQERPLTKKGRRQAEGIAAALGSVGVERILSSPYVRCMETVGPLGETLGVEVEAHDALAEDPDRGELADLLEEVAGSATVMCTHGDVIPALLERLQWMGTTFRSGYAAKKGSTWSVSHDGHAFLEAVYWDPPA